MQYKRDNCPYLDEHIFVPVAVEGDKVFHYTSAAGLQGIVGGEFWITERNFLNDPTEFKIGTEVLCEILRMNIEDTAVAERVETAFREEERKMTAFGTLDDTFAFAGEYIISLCLDKDSSLMWAQYSNFAGYAMGFDLVKLINVLGKDVWFHGEVIYDHRQQIESMEETLRAEIFDCESFPYISSWKDFERLTEEQLRVVVSHMYVCCGVYNMFYKRACFAGEHEYRIVLDCIHDKGQVREESRIPLHFRIKNEVLIPYVVRPFECKDCLETVTVGPKNNSDLALLGLKYFFRDKKMRVKLAKSEMPLRY